MLTWFVLRPFESTKCDYDIALSKIMTMEKTWWWKISFHNMNAFNSWKYPCFFIKLMSLISYLKAYHFDNVENWNITFCFFKHLTMYTRLIDAYGIKLNVGVFTCISVSFRLAIHQIQNNVLEMLISCLTTLLLNTNEGWLILSGMVSHSTSINMTSTSCQNAPWIRSTAINKHRFRVILYWMNNYVSWVLT